MNNPFLKYVGHRLREAKLHASRVVRLPGRGRRVVIFPDSLETGSSADLRGYSIGAELRRLGWRVTCVPPQLELVQRQRIVRLEKPNVILLVQSRHPLNRPKYYPETPCVFDADDADILDPRCADAVIECCRDSRAVIAGSRYVAGLFRPHNPRVTVVWTGSYAKPSRQPTPNQKRKSVVAWAHRDPFGFPAEGQLVMRSLLELARNRKYEFLLYGVPPSKRDRANDYLLPLRQAGITARILPPLPYQRFVRSLEEVAVGLQPVCIENEFSRGRSFGKLLAYMAANVAVVASDAVDHPLFFRNQESAVLLPSDPVAWARACDQLLAFPSERERMAEAARIDYMRRLTTAKAAELVSQQLLNVVGQTPLKV